MKKHPIWLIFAWLNVILAATMLVETLFPMLQLYWIGAVLAAAAPYGIVCWILATLIIAFASRGRARLFAALTAVGILGHATLLLPYLPHEISPAKTQLRIAAINLHFGEIDTDGLWSQLERYQPDVAVFTEITKSNVAALDVPERSKYLPYHLGEPGEDVGLEKSIAGVRGTMVYSRHPLVALDQLQDLTYVGVAANVQDPAGEYTLAAIHTANPLYATEKWINDGEIIQKFASEYVGKPLVIAGDFNATSENLVLRRILATGLKDSALSAKGGWQPTYPSHIPVLPPLIAIDHVLCSGRFNPLDTMVFDVSGTDHLGLVANLERKQSATR